MKNSLSLVIIISLISHTIAARVKKMTGGYTTYPGEFGYQVGLENPSGDYFCGGSLIHRQFVLTAAHCVLDENDKLKIDRMEVVAGTNDLFVTPATKAYARVDRVYVPGGYSYTSEWYLKDNIAVLKLKNPLNIGPGYALDLLNPPEVQNLYADEEAIVSGFGYEKIIMTQDSSTGKWWRLGSLTGILRFAITKVLSNSACGQYLRRDVPETLICAKILKPDEKIGLCAGDGGSPLVYNRSVIIGVANFSPYKCHEKVKPSVYTRVSSYLDFIENVIENSPSPDVKIFFLK